MFLYKVGHFSSKTQPQIHIYVVDSSHHAQVTIEKVFNFLIYMNVNITLLLPESQWGRGVLLLWDNY